MVNDQIKYFNTENSSSNLPEISEVYFSQQKQQKLLETNVQNPISGTYEGKMTSPDTGSYFCEIRIDVDQRYPNSPILHRISGDFFKLTKNLSNISFISDSKGQQKSNLSTNSKTYLESWIVDSPKLSLSTSKVEISGTVRFWNNGHPLTEIVITIQPGTLADVRFSETGGYIFRYTCNKISDCFRKLNLEIDVTKSVKINHPEPILPSYDTHLHSLRPFDLPRRVLTIEEVYREAGVCVSINSQRDIIDDTATNLHALHDAELHEIMTTYYNEYQGNWPNWNMWCLLCGSYEDLEEPQDGKYVLGVMFDAYVQDNRIEERQGFAIFRNHHAFNHLVAGITNTSQAESMRDFLYTYIHEAGHAFNFLHSWDKNRQVSESFMNYPDVVDEIFNEGYFWKNFYWRFDDEELIHLRHGNRPAVIMGGDAWSSGGHLESPTGAMFQIEEGELPVELLIRSEAYFEFMETVSIELRIRNLLPMSINVKSILNPAYGNIIVYIQPPNGNIIQYQPVIVKESSPFFKTLQPTNSDGSGLDRHSEVINLTYGKYGFYFKEPGEYKIRSIYTGAGNNLIPSNTLTLRIGHDQSNEKKYAKDYFSDQVGMNLYLHGSMSRFLSHGRKFLDDFAKENKDTVLGAKVGSILGKSEMRSFYSLENKKLKQTHSPNYQKGLKLTEPAYDVYKKEKSKKLNNILFHRLVDLRSNAMLKTNEHERAKEELSELYKILSSREVKSSILNKIKSDVKTIETKQKK